MNHEHCPDKKNPVHFSRSMKPQSTLVIGAGPGGLSAAMILAKRGLNVTVLERNAVVGGRNAAMSFDGFTFDVGPTFVMMPEVYEDIFRLAGRDYYKEFDFIHLDPLYQLHYPDGRKFTVSFDKAKLKEEMDRVFPGEWAGYERWYKFHEKKYDRVVNCLRIPYQRPWSYLNPKLLRALPVLQAHRTVMSVLKDYFKSEDLMMAMAFQAKYLGMSPWNCPGTFTILPFMEHRKGLVHFRGGVNQLSRVMARVATDNGATIRLNAEVKDMIIEHGKAVGVRLANGEELRADTVVMNADFADGMTRFVPDQYRGRWSNNKLKHSGYSCSTYMMYLGIKGTVDLPHHNVFFGHEYRHYLEQINVEKVMPTDPAFYLQNATVLDPSLAPLGHSTLYILAPVPNLTGKVDWASVEAPFREQLLDLIAERAGITDIRELIVAERTITVKDWRDQLRVYNGAVFNLAHNVSQMLYLRPHNAFESLPGLYIVGGGTHPGSGLPTIMDSGRIAANLITGHHEA